MDGKIKKVTDAVDYLKSVGFDVELHGEYDDKDTPLLEACRTVYTLADQWEGKQLTHSEFIVQTFCAIKNLTMEDIT